MSDPKPRKEEGPLSGRFVLDDIDGLEIDRSQEEGEPLAISLDDEKDDAS